jgi:hypothetical protein
MNPLLNAYESFKHFMSSSVFRCQNGMIHVLDG